MAEGAGTEDLVTYYVIDWESDMTDDKAYFKGTEDLTTYHVADWERDMKKGKAYYKAAYKRQVAISTRACDRIDALLKENAEQFDKLQASYWADAYIENAERDLSKLRAEREGIVAHWSKRYALAQGEIDNLLADNDALAARLHDALRQLDAIREITDEGV